MGVDVLFVGNAWVVPIVKLEKRIPCAGFRIIISKLHHRQEPRPVVLFVINQSSKVSFHYAVLPLNLAIGLRVEGGREPPFDAQEIAQRGSKLGSEY